MKRGIGTTSIVVLLAATAACGSDDGAGRGDETRITVFAAASLTATFTELGRQFEESHEGVEVALNFAGSSDLVAQIQQGAPADVFASADTASMHKAVGDGLLDGDPVDFASNTLEIAVPPDNPAGVSSLPDLTGAGINVVVCAPEVPCGAATEEVLDAAGLEIEPVSEEQSVTDVLNKVTTGEADAGLVYVTDVKAAGDQVLGITFPESSSAVNVYPIAAVAGGDNADLSQEFVDLVTGTAGQSVLADAGFAKP